MPQRSCKLEVSVNVRFFQIKIFLSIHFLVTKRWPNQVSQQIVLEPPASAHTSFLFLTLLFKRTQVDFYKEGLDWMIFTSMCESQSVGSQHKCVLFLRLSDIMYLEQYILELGCVSTRDVRGMCLLKTKSITSTTYPLSAQRQQSIFYWFLTNTSLAYLWWKRSLRQLV